MIASRCAEDSFSLVGEYKAEFIEGVENFMYLGLMLERLYDNWSVVCLNEGKVHRVWIQRG